MTPKSKNKYLYNRYYKTKNYNLWTIISIILFSLFITYCNIRPFDTGILGKTISNVMSQIFGVTRFFISVIFLYWIWYILKSQKKQFTEDIVLTVVFIILFSGTTKVILKIINLPITKVNYLSGWLGNTVFETAERIFGTIFGSVVIILLLLYVITLLFEISLIDIAFEIYNKLIEDFKNWRFEVKRNNKETDGPSRYKQQRAAINSNSIAVEEGISYSLHRQTQPANKQDVIRPSLQISEPEIEKKEDKKVLQKPIKTTIKTMVVSDKTYVFPPTDILFEYKTENVTSLDFEENAKKLENVIKEFNIEAKVVNISSGPVVTLYELELEPGVKVQTITSLKDNIALGMKASNIRIIAPLPGKGTIGIEIPNPYSRIVSLREILEDSKYKNLIKNMKLPIILGKTVDGDIYVDDIVNMPHMLVAGATGSGKSVCVHSIIMSLLYRCPPDYVKLVLIDPKRLELIHYNGIPHLYDPNCEPENVKVITSSKEAAKVLNSLVKVMEQRYEKFASACVRNIDSYNEMMVSKGNQPEYYIVVIIDEFADLILTAPREIEDAIQRLAQMARAVGIHLILATQRPSVDVITGVIKANFSCRVAFQVLSKTDSRVILDTTGAEDLLGRGDMLYLPTGAPKPIRLQGAYVSEKEINKVVEFISSQGIKPTYEPLIKAIHLTERSLKEKEIEQKENLYEALILIKERRRVSQDLLKAYFRSSAKATDILSLLEVKGFIYKPEGTNRWNINFDRVEEAIKNYETNKTFEESVKDVNN